MKTLSFSFRCLLDMLLWEPSYIVNFSLYWNVELPKIEELWWLGGRKVTDEIFRWKSNSQIICYTKWNPGEPNSPKISEACMGMRKDFDYRWIDVLCNDAGRYICEPNFYTRKQDNWNIKVEFSIYILRDVLVKLLLLYSLISIWMEYF